MPVVCYRVESYQLEDIGGAMSVTVRTRILESANTKIADLIKKLPARVELAKQEQESRVCTETYVVYGASERNLAALLEAHRAPAVTAITDCDVSVCLDFHRYPDGAGDLERTEIGSLVYEAKYDKDDGAREKLARMACDFAAVHPVFRRARGVVAVPRSELDAGAGLPGDIADAVARYLGVDRQPLLRRVREPPVPQKDILDGVDPYENQKGTMQAHDANGLDVIVIDDLLEHGASLREATRALRDAGAKSVVSLCFSKNLNGTRGYPFNDE